MGVAFPPPTIDHALDEIEGRILPSMSEILDGVLEAAAMARAGIDAEAHGAELRRVVRELQEVTRQMEALSMVPQAAPALRISA